MFESYEYYGGAHGDGEAHVKLFKRDHRQWVRIVDDNVVSTSTECQSRIGSLLYRKIRPQLVEKQVPAGTKPTDILASAKQTLTPDGVEFWFPSYAFDTRISPWPVVMTYGTLDNCFAPKLGDH
jgi:hypothetical protein